MRLQVKGKNVEVSPSLREYAEAKLKKLDRQLAEPTQVGVLQIAKAAVQGAMVIERGTAAEVVPLDQRDMETARRGVPCRHQAADAATDHQQVEGA